MPRSRTVPAYRLHKASGQARVIIRGKHIYLGPYGSAASREAYARLIAEQCLPTGAAPRQPLLVAGFPDLTLNELLVRYMDFATQYYQEEGEPTKELVAMRDALGPVRLLYGSLAARDFGPLKLKAVRQHMIERGLARGVINRRVNRIKRVIKWAVSEELLPPGVYEGRRTVTGLRFGRSAARETDPVGPVPDAYVDAVLPHLSPPIAAMIQLQRLTGMRPGEVVLMRPCDIDVTGEIWIYEPLKHKNRWRGQRRTIPLGPAAKAIVHQFLSRSTDAFLFSPAEAEKWRNEQRALRRDPQRKTKVYPSELRARERRRARARRHAPRRPKGTRYTVDSYRRAITYAIARVNRMAVETRTCMSSAPIPSWHPHQLRHTFATRVRKQFGVEAAQVGLGHARTDVVEIYAEKNLELAMKVARLTG